VAVHPSPQHARCRAGESARSTAHTRSQRSRPGPQNTRVWPALLLESGLRVGRIVAPPLLVDDLWGGGRVCTLPHNLCSLQTRPGLSLALRTDRETRRW
jgi:hypothetical protein